jgi:hypothetical protein
MTVMEFHDLVNLVWDTEDFDAMLAAAERLKAVVIEDVEMCPGRTFGDQIRHILASSAGESAERRKFTREAADSTARFERFAREQALHHASERIAAHNMAEFKERQKI